ncbi:MAG: hypothetical protein WCO03_02430 [bacterium]
MTSKNITLSSILVIILLILLVVPDKIKAAETTGSTASIDKIIDQYQSERTGIVQRLQTMPDGPKKNRLNQALNDYDKNIENLANIREQIQTAKDQPVKPSAEPTLENAVKDANNIVLQDYNNKALSELSSKNYFSIQNISLRETKDCQNNSGGNTGGKSYLFISTNAPQDIVRGGKQNLIAALGGAKATPAGSDESKHSYLIANQQSKIAIIDYIAIDTREKTILRPSACLAISYLSSVRARGQLTPQISSSR